MEFSPYAYNESYAQEILPLTKIDVQNSGAFWREFDDRQYQTTISWDDLPDDISEVQDDITKEVILCEEWSKGHDAALEHNCSKAFRILPEELTFYRRMGLPLPRKCFNSRHFERTKLRNPFKLYPRTCQCAGTQSDNKVYSNTIEHTHHGENHCPNEFETSYGPEREEIVYCEQCYQQEVV